MAVLITGGTGFVGSFVVRALLEIDEIPVVLDIGEPGDSLQDFIGKFVYVKGNMTDFDLLLQTIQNYGIDRVIHLAALLSFGCERDPQRAIEVNVQGTLKVLEASRITGIKKIVFASSLAVYGSQAGLLTEENLIPPNAPLYGVTKLLAESLLERYHQIYGIPFIALRYGGLYGPGEVRSSGMAEVTKKIESTILGKDVIIEDLGGEELRNFTFVKDAAQATVKALFTEKNIHKVFNIAAGEDSYVTSKEFHRIMKTLSPSAGKAVFKGRGQDQGRLDISLARTELGYCPEYSLERGIQEDIDFFLSHKK